MRSRKSLLAAGDDLMPFPMPELARRDRKSDARRFTDLTVNAERQRLSRLLPPAKSPIYTPPALDDEAEDELSQLPAEPTDEELMAYANAHPTVKKAMRIFRGRDRRGHKT